MHAALSALIEIRANTGSCTFTSVDANTLKIVAPGSVSCPDMILSSASRCSGVGTHVDDRLRFAVTEVDGLRPGEHTADRKTVELHLAEVSAVDLYADRRVAMAVGRQGHELTRTTPRAIARGDIETLQMPVDETHGGLR